MNILISIIMLTPFPSEPLMTNYCDMVPSLVDSYLHSKQMKCCEMIAVTAHQLTPATIGLSRSGGCNVHGEI